VGVEIVNYVVPCSLSAALYSPDTDGLFLGVVVRDTKAGSPAHEPSRWSTGDISGPSNSQNASTQHYEEEKNILLWHQPELPEVIKWQQKAVVTRMIHVTACTATVGTSSTPDSAQTVQTSAKAKISTKSDPTFESRFRSGCLADRSQNVVDSLSCWHQSFRRVSSKSASDCMRNANKSPKNPYSTLWGKCKSNTESVSGSGSPPKVNQLFLMVDPLITPSLNESADYFCSTPVHRITNKLTWSHNLCVGGSK